MAQALRVSTGAEIMDIASYLGNAPAEEPPLPFLTLDQLQAQALSLQWLVKGVIPSESLGIVFGGSGTFKSFIALDLALHVAHGMKWMGKKTRKGPVVFIAAEGGAGLWRRIEAWHKVRGLSWKVAQIHVIPVAVDLGSESSRVREAAAAHDITPALVVVDTMSQTFNGEENSATEVAGYLRELGLQFRAVWQCAVLVIHHTGHQATERPRGSSTIRANVDFMFGVFRDEKEMMATVECVKQKDGETGEPTSFGLQVVELGTDEDGDAITSLVATEIRGAEATLQVMDYEASKGRGGKNKLFLDLAHNGIEEAQLRKLFYDAIDGDSDTKRQTYYRARKWAINAQIIEIAQGYVLRHGA